ncbi:hypothetical protein GCM10009609_37500 [Pseudonocardia aurantiaca]
MSEDHPASFRRWMKENLVQVVHPKAFYGLEGDAASVEEERLPRGLRQGGEVPPSCWC